MQELTVSSLNDFVMLAGDKTERHRLEGELQPGLLLN